MAVILVILHHLSNYINSFPPLISTIHSLIGGGNFRLTRHQCTCQELIFIVGTANLWKAAPCQKLIVMNVITPTWRRSCHVHRLNLCAYRIFNLVLRPLDHVHGTTVNLFQDERVIHRLFSPSGCITFLKVLFE